MSGPRKLPLDAYRWEVRGGGSGHAVNPNVCGIVDADVEAPNWVAKFHPLNGTADGLVEAERRAHLACAAPHLYRVAVDVVGMAEGFAHARRLGGAALEAWVGQMGSTLDDARAALKMAKGGA